MSDFLTRLATRAIGFSHELAPVAAGTFIGPPSPESAPSLPMASPSDWVRAAVARAEVDTLRRAPTPKVQVPASRVTIDAVADAPAVALPAATVSEPSAGIPASPTPSRTRDAVPVARDIDATRGEFAVATPSVVRKNALPTTPSGPAETFPHVATHEEPLRSARASAPSQTAGSKPSTQKAGDGMASSAMVAMHPLVEVQAQPSADNTADAAAPERGRAATVQEAHPAPTLERVDTTRKHEAEHDVHVSIGTIHVKTRNAPVPPSRAPNTPAASPRLTLDDYLARRSARTR